MQTAKGEQTERRARGHLAKIRYPGDAVKIMRTSQILRGTLNYGLHRLGGHVLAGKKPP